MKTSDLKSFTLMPSFAGYYAFACKALDAWMSNSWTRANVFGSPWSLEAINALTDEELEAQYKLYSVLPYYPDLDRENRNQLLYLQNALRQRTTCADSMQQIIRYLANGTFSRVLITISGDFLYDITLYSDYINFSDDIYKSIINACRELVRPSQQLIIFDAHTYEMETDGDVWALAIVGQVKHNVNCIKAIKLGMDSTWTLTATKHLVDEATVALPALSTPALIGVTTDFYHTKAEFIEKIKRMYTGNTSGDPWVYDGTFGIYRLGAPDDIWRVYADGREERYE